jgi:crotonobetainyl-CoA:carnitine CoA-transferase CaiB-like acyl-CoA transferase
MRVLEGLKVVDAATFIAAPCAATALGDFGAEVIKIEAPGGDPWRPMYANPGMPKSTFNYGWQVDNRGKRSITLDLKRESSREVLHKLVRWADVFITNYPLDVRGRLGATYADLASLNPRLIYASFTGYGEDGPDRERPGFDSVVWWARSGLMDTVRSSHEHPPARSLPGMGDHPSGMGFLSAILLGLYQRERTGKGCEVGSSLLMNGLWSNAAFAQAALAGATFVPRPPRERASNALTNHYRCRDGHWFILSMVSEERDWPAFLRAIDRPELAQDARFATKAARHTNAAALTVVLDEVFATRDWVQWQAPLEATGITLGIVQKPGDIATDEQMKASGAVVPMAEPIDGVTHTISSPFWIRGQEKVPATRAPDAGEHTEAVLQGLGYDTDAIARLKDTGALG